MTFLDKIIKTDVRAILVIGFLVLTAYSFMLSSPFKAMDDDFSIVRNVEIRDLKYIPDFFRSSYFKTDTGYYRPLVYVTYALEYYFFKLNSFYYNLDNVFLHILNAILVFYLGLLIFRDRRRAFFVAFLFAIHPIHWEAVSNTSGRSIILCASFVLGGLIAFLRFIRDHKRRYLAAAVVCYALALLSKESGGMLLFVAAAYLFLVERRPWKDVSVLVPFVLVACGYVAIRHALEIATLMAWPTFRDMAIGVISFLNGLWTYAVLLAFPVDLRLDRAHVIFKSFADPGVWATLIALGLLLFGLFHFRRRISGLTWFCLAWIAFELFPVSQIVTTIGVYLGAISLAEHFLYVTSVPVFILTVTAIDRAVTILAERKIVSLTISGLALAGVSVFFFLILCQQNVIASHEFLMIRSALQIDPGNARQQYSMGILYLKAGQRDKSRDCFKNAVKIDPLNPKYRVALGMAFSDHQDLLGAVEQYEVAKPETQELKELVQDNRKMLYDRLCSGEAAAQIAAATPGQLFILGNFYFRQGDLQRAVGAFDRLLTAAPQHARGFFNLSVTCQAAKASGKDLSVCARVDQMDPAMRARVKLIEEELAHWHPKAVGKNSERK